MCLNRLQQVSYIRHRVCRVPVNGPASLESLMKLSCFCNGPAAVPCWLDYLENMGGIHDVTTTIGRRTRNNRVVCQLDVSRS